MKKLLGETLYNIISNYFDISLITEIRLRAGQKVLLKTAFKELYADYIVDELYIYNLILNATSRSLYAHENEISDGFLNYKDGIRIGICGSVKINEKKTIAFSKYYSVCIRIQKKIIQKHSLECIIENFDNTLIIGLPYSGKTTLIRSLTENLSEKFDVVLIDERMEIAGADTGLLSGKRCDIIQGIPKKYLFENIVRSMSPQIIVCDELYSKEDIESIERLYISGIKCLASFHAEKFELLPEKLRSVFTKIITLSSKPQPGSIISIISK